MITCTDDNIQQHLVVVGGMVLVFVLKVRCVAKDKGVKVPIEAVEDPKPGDWGAQPMESRASTYHMIAWLSHLPQHIASIVVQIVLLWYPMSALRGGQQTVRQPAPTP
mgnify:CR=1 FL=1